MGWCRGAPRLIYEFKFHRELTTHNSSRLHAKQTREPYSGVQASIRAGRYLTALRKECRRVTPEVAQMSELLPFQALRQRRKKLRAALLVAFPARRISSSRC